MCGNLLQIIAEWNWIEIIKIIISLGMVIIAWLALQTWKKKSKAQRQCDFMDEITNSAHEFIASMTDPTEIVKYIKIGIQSHAGAFDLDQSIKNAEAVAYIQKHGQEDSKKLLEYLNVCKPSLIKLRSLAAKGQVLGLINYADCQNAVRMLTWQYERIQALCVIIGSPSLNWHNTEVQQTLGKVIQFDPDEIRKDIETYSVQLLTFVKNNYEEIFK
jgi:hypothetical protein